MLLFIVEHLPAQLVKLKYFTKPVFFLSIKASPKTGRIFYKVLTAISLKSPFYFYIPYPWKIAILGQRQKWAGNIFILNCLRLAELMKYTPASNYRRVVSYSGERIHIYIQIYIYICVYVYKHHICSKVCTSSIFLHLSHPVLWV